MLVKVWSFSEDIDISYVKANTTLFSSVITSPFTFTLSWSMMVNMWSPSIKVNLGSRESRGNPPLYTFSKSQWWPYEMYFTSDFKESDMWDTLLVKLEASNSAHFYNTTINIKWEWFSKLPIYISEVKGIGEFITGKIYWKIDKEYIGWIMLKKDTTATTWNISLWNAVGYITINFNWEVLKIPYYND